MRLGAGLGGLALLTLAMFIDTLLWPGTRVLGVSSNDLSHHTLAYRDFGFGELAHGNFPLWNPHIFSGAPFFGSMQSTLLYPLNWLFLVLPHAVAVNWSIAVNAWLLGAFMYLWAARRGTHPLAAFVAGALVMLCAPHFLRVYSGPPNNLAAMTWVPLLFLVIDEWLATRRWAWCLAGMAVVAMQVFAGQPQYLYFTAIAAGTYSLLRLAEEGGRRAQAVAGLFTIAAGGALLAAVELIAGAEATAGSVRGTALPYEFAASFSFPPENLVTLLVPGFFGDAVLHPYWGRWYLWEACAFIGVTGLALAVHGMRQRKVPGRRALLVSGAVLMVLALGANTPLFHLLYDWLPGFDRFRGASKFMFFAVMIAILFAAHGLDRILLDGRPPRGALLAAGGLALGLLLAGALLQLADWGAVVRAVQATRESYADATHYTRPALLAAARGFAALGLLVAGATLAAAAGLAFWAGHRPRAGLLLGLLAVAELFAFARMHRPTFDSTTSVIAPLREFLAANPGDYRILNLPLPNSAMQMRARDAWGYDPGASRRYAELIAWSEGLDPRQATMYVTFERFHAVLAMLRVKYVVTVKQGVMRITPAALAPLRQVELVGAYRLLGTREAILAALDDPSFDPRKEVLLERAPQPAPRAATSQGQAVVTRQGTDYLDIDADVAAPSILLVTDAWAPGWRVSPREGGSASSYELMPANYALRAVALDAGRHRLRLEYAPAGFRLGALVSACAWLAWIGGALLLWRRGGFEGIWPKSA